DLRDDPPGDRLDVRSIRRFGIGHDRSGIGIHQDDVVPFFAQSFACLSAAIIKLARLADDDGAGADEEYFSQVGAFWHGQWLKTVPISGITSRTTDFSALLHPIG